MAIEAGTIAAKVVGVSHGKRATGEAILAKGGGVTDNVELEFLDAIPTGTTPATGGNAFLTGVFPGPNTSFEIKAQALNQTMTDSYHVAGALAANAECRWGVDQNLNGVRTNFGILTNMGGWAATYAFYAVAAGNGNSVNFEYKSANPAVYGYDSTTKTVYTQAVGFGARTSTVLPDQTAIGTFTKEFMLFGRPTNNTAISPTANITTRAARLYYAKFWENGVLTKHFVPYRKNGVICLWEKVSNTFVYNYGTGYLFAGPEKTSEVPEDNTELEYLESSGTQYIDTGIIPTGATKVRCVFSLDNLNNFSPVFWSRGSSSTDKAFCFEGENNGQARWDYGNYGALQVANVLVAGQRYTVEVNSGTLSVAESTLQRTEQTFTGAGSIILFNFCNYVNGERQMLSAACQPVRIYSFDIYSGSTLVLSLVPYRKNGVVCMYDKVSQTYFYNAGTGTFTGGPAVADNERVEYIQSNSCYSVYIDLNSFVNTTNGTSYSGEIKWAPNNTTNDKWIFGDARIVKRVGVYAGGTPVNFTIHGVGTAKVNGTTLGSVATLTDDGTTVTSTFTTASFKSMYLFRQYDPNNPAIINAKFYYMKLWDANNNLAHHLVPVVHDGTAMVKDLVTGLYYGKASGCFGQFAASPPVKEMPDRFIDWQTATLNTKCADPEMDDVVFYNLDGTVCWHGTYKEAQRLSELPTPKEIPGCTFQCWNWTVDDILGLNEMAPWACIAPHYVTNDDKTHFSVRIDGNLNTRTLVLSRLMCCSTNDQSNWSFTVDWGDGTTETFAQTTRSSASAVSHTYAADGNYDMTLDATCPFALHDYQNNGDFGLFGDSKDNTVKFKSMCCIKAVYTGSRLRNRTGSNQSTFAQFRCADYIVLHKDVCTFPSNSGGFSTTETPGFRNGIKFKIVAIPRGTTGVNSYAFNSAAALINPCFPATIYAYNNYWMQTTISLKRVVINPRTTQLKFYDVSNASCALERIDIPKCVDCNITNAQNRDWRWRYWTRAENSWSKYIGWVYNNSSTSYTMDASFFQNARKLKHIFIEFTQVTTLTLNASLFDSCVDLQDIWFKVPVVPTINSNTYFQKLFNQDNTGIAWISNIKIHVPRALYDTWKATAAWAPAANMLVPFEPGECPVFGEENEEYRK